MTKNTNFKNNFKNHKVLLKKSKMIAHSDDDEEYNKQMI